MNITKTLAMFALVLGAISIGCVAVPNVNAQADADSQRIRDLNERIAGMERQLNEQDSGTKCRADRIKRYAYRVRGQEIPAGEDASGRQPDTRFDAVRIQLAGMGWIETTQIDIPFDKLNERLITICPDPEIKGKGELRYGGYDGDYVEM